VTLVMRRNLSEWAHLAPRIDPAQLRMSSRARSVLEWLQAHGASFFDEVCDGTRLPKSFVEDALGELTAWGLVNCDSFAGLRVLILPSDRRKPVGGAASAAAPFGAVWDRGRRPLGARAPRANRNARSRARGA
jgi:ATP-dependent Lhr-like helicase